jgi:anti-sigma B factor antagonist
MSLAELETELVDAVLFARIEGEIDMSNAAELGSAISARTSNEVLGVVLDLSRVGYLDSVGLRAIFDLRGRLRDRGQGIRLVVPPGATIAFALEIVGAPKTIGILDSPEAALESILAAIPQPRSAAGSNLDAGD